MEIENEISADNTKDGYREDGISESHHNTSVQIFKTLYDDHPTIKGSDSYEDEDFSPRRSYPDVKIGTFP